MRFVLVDRILRWDPGREAVALKNVSNSEDFFADHFPGRPIMPGCLILETCDQAARLFLGSTFGFTRLPVLEELTNATFRHFVQPGDALWVHLTLVSFTAGSAAVRAAVSIGERAVAQVAMGYRLVDSTEDPGATRVCAQMREFYTILTTDPISIAGENLARGMGHGREVKGA